MTRHTAFTWAVGSLVAGAFVAGTWAPAVEHEMMALQSLPGRGRK